MRLSRLFGKTLRADPVEAETPSHRLLLRGGFIHPLAAGLYSSLPLGWRVQQRVEQIIREEMDAAGGQEIRMPILHPQELWELTGRAAALGPVLFRLQDRRERPLVLAATHEEVVTLLARTHIQSYRDLPQRLYQLQTKFRDEPRPRGGLLRVREFVMKDCYSFDADEEGLEESYQAMRRAYERIFARCGLTTLTVEADSGAIGGKESHEFMVLAETGEDDVVYCEACGYAANVERAEFRKPAVPSEEPREVEEVHTPDTTTIPDLARFLGIREAQTLKAVFYSTADGRMVFVVIRGDLEVNEIKLRNLLKATDLRLATDAEVAEAGIVAGFASPRGIEGVTVIADDSVLIGSNFVAGANRPNYHLRNVNYPRDFTADHLADIARAYEGAACNRCGSALRWTRGIEVGHIFKLRSVYSEKLEATFQARDGGVQPITMGCYGIGVGRTMASIVEQHHDERGIRWPVSVAPFAVHLVALNLDRAEVREAADALAAELAEAGLEPLYDDRDESAGVKFNDADLLGMPVRLTVSPRTLGQGVVELKRRTDEQATLVARGEVVGRVRELLGGR
ncbi:MAG TPA: proline--tRNA ligase [Dehalococcoidia bacterium]|nr:proline--tRNA ligase [Dehalococcoidia bacterium]